MSHPDQPPTPGKSPKKSRAAKIAGIILIVIGGLLTLSVLNNLASGRMMETQARLSDDSVAQFTFVFLNFFSLLIAPLGIWLLVKKPRR
ncbi:hypothetical protein [Nesterenkonia muleiensis]|uniref:hypothetical protein n=1 Tax=Nesterenkonia muleiensis TaxID=2282648 RepID=UPI000E7080FE|nr:hypothetical protein [Nesterenkonia muleiensis]